MLLSNVLVWFARTHALWQHCQLHKVIYPFSSLIHDLTRACTHGTSKRKVWNEQGLTYTLLTFSSFSFLYLSKCIIYGFQTLRTIGTLQQQHDKNSSGFFFCSLKFSNF
jgi:hypothetical protein